MVLRTVALTGASGMLGRHIASALSSAGFRVLAYARSAEKLSKVSDSQVWDLAQWRSFDELDKLFEGAHAVVHAGAMVPVGAMAFDKGKMFNVNVRSCLNLGEWALARSTPVVHISGAIVYAEPDRVDIDETASTGYSVLGGFYGLTKVLAEDIFRRLKDQGLRLAIVRPSSIYGAGLPATKMLKAFLTTAARDETIELTSPVDDRIDLIHAADVATAVTGVLQAEAWETFNLASGHPSTVLEIANTCLAVTGKGRVLIRDAEEGARNPARRFFLNCKRAQKDLGWTTRVDLKHGLAALYENRVTNLV